MKDENDDHKIRILQAKMDAIKKTSKKKPDPPEQITDLEEEPLVPEPNVMTEPEPLQEDKLPNVPEEDPNDRNHRHMRMCRHRQRRQSQRRAKNQWSSWTTQAQTVPMTMTTQM